MFLSKLSVTDVNNRQVGDFNHSLYKFPDHFIDRTRSMFKNLDPLFTAQILYRHVGTYH